MSALFIPISSCLCDTWTHNSYKFSLLDRFIGGTSPCVLWNETYGISFEEFDVQFDDPGAHVY